MFENGIFTKKQKSALNRLKRLTVVKFITVNDFHEGDWLNEFDYIWNEGKHQCDLKEKDMDSPLNNRAFKAATKWCNDTAHLINEDVVIDAFQPMEGDFDLDDEGNVIEFSEEDSHE